MEDTEGYTHLKKLNSRMVIIVGVALITIISSLNLLDKPSEDYVDRAIVKTTVVFASARALNAAISVFQTTTVNVQAVGGVSLGVGEVLDPFNDLVEQWASLMKLSIGSLIIQKLVLEIAASGFFKIFLGLSGVALVVAVQFSRRQYISLLSKIFLFLVFLRFTFVFIVLLNSLVTHSFIDEKTGIDVAQVNEVSNEIEQSQIVGSLGEEELEILGDELLLLVDEREMLLSNIAVMDSPIGMAEGQVSEAEQRVAEAQEGVSLTDRLLSRDEGLESAQDALSQARSELEELVVEKDVLEERLEQVIDSIAAGEGRLAGRPVSFVDSIRDRMNVISSSVSIPQLKTKLDGLFAHIIRIMSLFFLETLILPLFFLFIFSKGMKAIWGVGIVDFVRPPLPKDKS